MNVNNNESGTKTMKEQITPQKTIKSVKELTSPELYI